MPAIFKSGSLKLLEPPGPVQACDGIALPFTYKQPNSSKQLPENSLLLLPQAVYTRKREMVKKSLGTSENPNILQNHEVKQRIISLSAPWSYVW